MTPLELSVLIHYHAHCWDWRDGDHSAPIYKTMFQSFVEKGLLVEKSNIAQKYHPTERLHAFVEMLCEIPLPVQKWVRPDSESACIQDIEKLVDKLGD